MKLNEYIVELVETCPRRYKIYVQAQYEYQAIEEAKKIAVEGMGATSYALRGHATPYSCWSENE